MPYRKQEFVNGEIYHTILRAIDDNLLFQDIDDYYRGIFSIYEFNNSNPVSIKERRKARIRIKKIQAVQGWTSGAEPIIVDEREKFIEVLTFCLMPNHIHLLVKQLKDNGITEFMRKEGTGLGGYLNRKYDRKGHVFQNSFSAVHIKNDEQLKTVFVYIHTNPISLIEPKWKEIRIKDLEKVIKFLENYKWSSYLDYIGKKNFPSVTERKFITEVMGSEQGCKDFIRDWVEYKGKIREFTNLTLE